MASHKEIKSRVLEFLLAGPQEQEGVGQQAEELIEEVQRAGDQSSLLREMTAVQEKTSVALRALEKTDIMEEFREYSALVLKEQILSLARCIEKLRANEEILCYPALVRETLKNIPKVMSQNSKIYQFLCATVKEIRLQLLSHFHKRFETHLTKSEELTLNSNYSELDDVSWETFLSSSRDYILAFMMVSLLPAAATGGNSKQLEEGYQECLDSAFTPLWGRFFFHLTSSRDAGSMEQILWTFEYTNTFIRLLMKFCTNLTVTKSELVVAYPRVDFRRAGISQIVEKTCRFMRSHVAECLLILNPLPPDSPDYSSSVTHICMSLIEHSLELDNFIYNFQNGEQELQEGGRTKSPLLLPISAVFCSNAIVRNIWTNFDHLSFKEFLLESLGPNRVVGHGKLNELYADSLHDDLHSVKNVFEGDDLFQCYFDHISQSDGYLQDLSGQAETSQRHRCFACVYDCLMLFRKAFQRYDFIPSDSQDIFCAYVLEALLLSAMGLVMFRTNSCPTLKLVFDSGRLPFYLQSGSMPEEGNAIIETAEFLKSFLSVEAQAVDHLGSDSKGKFYGTITPPSERFSENWSLLQSWIRTPDRRYISLEVNYEKGGEGLDIVMSRNDSHKFCAFDVIEKAFSLAEASGRILRDQKRKTFEANGNEKKGSISNIIDYACGVSDNMSEKVNNLLIKASVELHKNDVYKHIR